MNEDSDFEAQEVLIEFKENVSVTKKRKLNDSDDEYGKPVCKKCHQQFPSQSAFNVHKKSVHSDEPKEAQKIGNVQFWFTSLQFYTLDGVVLS